MLDEEQANGILGVVADDPDLPPTFSDRSQAGEAGRLGSRYGDGLDFGSNQLVLYRVDAVRGLDSREP